MKLYGHTTSPYVRKVRIALCEKNLPFTYIAEAPSDPGNRIATLNPLGKVPVLETDSGDILFDSALLVEYIDGLAHPRLIPVEGPSRIKVQLWHMLGSGMIDAVVARLIEMRRPIELQSSAVIARQEEKVARALAWADRAEKGPAYIFNDTFTLADLALGLALEYIDFRYPHDWRSAHPKLAQWLVGISTRGSFVETIPPGMEKR